MDAKKRLIRKRKATLHAVVFATQVMWSFQKRSDHRVTPKIDILFQNYNEHESKEMSARTLSTRLEIRQHCVLPDNKEYV